ncbi:MAG: RluA family pseudouridine synthase [Silvanigrellaceae bacterium]
MTDVSAEKIEVESFVVESDNVGLRLDVFLFKLVDFIPSRSFAQKLIDCHAVKVNGKPKRSSWCLLKGEVVQVDVSMLRPPPSVPSPQKMNLDILFEDDDILVVNKPAGLVVHPGAGVPDGTLVNAILAHTGATLPSLGDPLRAGLVHRLDRDTSGVMVVAKTQTALTGLSQQFASHSQLRRYRALVFGVPPANIHNVETWHGRDPKNRLRYCVQPEGQGKIARMNVHVDQSLAGGLASAVVCELHTGRTHQIRVQLSHLGFGLLGDSLYGQSANSNSQGSTPLQREKSLWPRVREAAQRQMLHAVELGIEHPVSRQPMLFQKEPPKDFESLEKMLAGWK